MIILDEIVRKQIREIEKECHALHLPPPPVGIWRLSVRDESLEYLSQSWVRNAYNSCSWGWFGDYDSSTFGEGTMGLKTTTAAAKTVNPESYRISAGIANDYYGIVIGTGDTPVSFENYNIESKILTGVTAGKMEYGATEILDINWDAGNKKFTIGVQRSFINNSGDTIVVKEVGLIGYSSGSFPYYLLLIRDVLVSPISVLDTQNLTVNYTLEFSYP